MRYFKSLVIKLGQALALFGGWGLFAISILDSSFFPIPSTNDVLLIVLASRHPIFAWVYALQATVGSVLGAYIMYWVGRRGGRLMARWPSPEKQARVSRWLERNDFVSVLVASLLPPPTPLKVFLFGAGALRVNAVRFGAALLVGRGVRFGIEAWLGARFGARALEYLKENVGWVSWLAAGLLVASVVAYGHFVRRRASASKSVPANPSGRSDA